MASARRCVTSG